MWIGNLALAGIPPFAGYYSKDAIIAAAYAAGTGVGMYGFVCTVLAAFLTAFYSWRLLIMTFHGTLARRSSRAGACARKPAGDDRAAAGAGHRRGDRRQAAGPLVHRRGLAGVLERQHLQRAQPTMCSRVWSMCRRGSSWRRCVVGLLGIALAYVMYMVVPAAADAARHAVPRHLPVPAEQVVFRRAVRRDLRAAADPAGARVLADRRRHASSTACRTAWRS